MADKGSERQIECTIPVLPVRKLAVSVEFFTAKLGFKVDWGDPARDKICSVSKDGSAIMLMERSEEFSPGWVWIGLEDDSLFDEYRSNGVQILQEPKNFPWAYEMKFADVDGNVLWLGTEPRSDIPFESMPPLR